MRHDGMSLLVFESKVNAQPPSFMPSGKKNLSRAYHPHAFLSFYTNEQRAIIL
jgi:hypothetical protein